MRSIKEDNISKNNHNNNLLYKKLEKGESNSKINLSKINLKNSNSPLSNFFLHIFLVLSICLTTTLFLYYRFSSHVTDELLLVSDIHKLKAFIKPIQFIEEKNIDSFIKNKSNKDNKYMHDIKSSKFFYYLII